MKKNVQNIKLSIISGFLEIIFYLSFKFISYLLYPSSYSPFSNWASDLGNSNFNPKGAIYYNLGVIIGGGFMLLFFIGFKNWETHNKILLHSFQFFGILAAITNIMSGVHSEDFPIWHSSWSFAFFTFISITLVISSIFLIRESPNFHTVAIIGLIIAIINSIFIITLSFAFVQLLYIPIIEWFAIYSLIFYIILLNLKLITILKIPNSS